VTAPGDPRRRRPPLDEWPALDRDAWTSALSRRTGFEGATLARLAPATIRKIRGGYARWLGYLIAVDRLDPDDPPAERVTEEHLAGYVDEMRALGNRDHTIVGNIEDLASALGMMVPEADFTWVRRPGGRSLRSLLSMKRKHIDVVHSRLLFNWAIELMERGFALRGASRRRVMVRDGLMIAILASRGMRLRSLAAMELGRNLVASEDGYRVRLRADDVKTRQEIEYRLPNSLTPYVDRYLETERAELLGSRRSEALWVNWDGQRLGYRGVDKRIRWQSAKRFGKPFGAHFFRYCIATTGPIEDPRAPGAAAATLGISAAVAEEHYNRGGQAEAATRFHRELAREREETRRAASRHFGTAHGTSTGS
jgi:hypothetical protein